MRRRRRRRNGRRRSSLFNYLWWDVLVHVENIIYVKKFRSFITLIFPLFPYASSA